MERQDIIVLISSVKTGTRSGKTTFAQFMSDYISDRTYKKTHMIDYHIVPQIVEFSSSLKDICRDVFCAPEDYVTGAFKEEPLGDVKIEGYTDNASCRDIMRYLGTEVFRDKFGEDIWVKRMHNKICQFIAVYDEGFKSVNENLATVTFIPDFRFNNELLYLIEKGWKCIWVDVERPDRGVITTSHRSENSLDLNYQKYEIINDGDLDQLKKDAENLIGAIIQEHFESIGCC